MSDSEFILPSSTRAIVGSEDALNLIEQKERLEQAVVANDPALTLDTAKALLESVFKTIIADRVEEPDLNQNMSPLYRNVRDVLPLNRNEDAAELLKRLTNPIVHHVAELRNKYGAASHGDDGYYENPFEMAEAEMVAHFADGLVGFLFNKHKAHGNPELAARIYYSDHPEFNDYLDAQRDGYKMDLDDDRTIDLTPSYLLFVADEEAYKELLLQFLREQDEDAGSLTAVAEYEPAEPVIVAPAQPEAQPETPAISEGEAVVQIMQVMLVNDEARASVTDEQLQSVAEFVVDYAEHHAGVDWQNRSALKARFRIQVRRRLIGVTFTESFLDDAAEAAVDKAVELFPINLGES